MSDILLTVLRLIFLGLLYLFVWQISKSLTGHLGLSWRWDRHHRGRRLVVMSSDQGKETDIMVKDVVVIGSSLDADYHLSDPYASDFHLRMTLQGGRLQLTDLGSTNGTYVNGKRVSNPVHLNRGDEVQIGKTIMEVR